MTTYAVAGWPATVAHRWPPPANGGPDGATVTVVDLRTGTTVAEDAEATGADGVWTYTVTPDKLDGRPTVLEATWSGTGGWSATTATEVASEGPVDPADVPDFAGEVDPATLAATVVAHAERHTDATWSRRWARVEAHVWRGGLIRLDRYYPLTGATVADADGNPLEVRYVARAGAVRLEDTDTLPGPVVVDLEYGRAAPADLADALTEAARQLAADRNNPHKPARAEYAEGTTWLVATASGRHGRPFGIPDVDTVVDGYRSASAVA